MNCLIEIAQALALIAAVAISALVIFEGCRFQREVKTHRERYLEQRRRK